VAEPTASGEGAVTAKVLDATDVELVPDASSTLPHLSLSLAQFVGRRGQGQRAEPSAADGGDG
jgi:hypothetical protein